MWRYVPPDQARAVQVSVSGSSASSTGSTPEVQPLKVLQLNKTPLRQVRHLPVNCYLFLFKIPLKPHCSALFFLSPSLQGYLVPSLTATLRRRSLTCCPTSEETSLLLPPLTLPTLPTLPILHIFPISQVNPPPHTLNVTFSHWCRLKPFSNICPLCCHRPPAAFIHLSILFFLYDCSTSG